MEYLSRLLKTACQQADFRFHLYYKSLGLTYLMFADDLMLFCKADVPPLHILMKTL